LKVLVIDDHPLIREGMRLPLRQLDPDAEILEAQHAEEGLAWAAANPDLDLVLLDIGLPGMDGLAALKRFRERHPAAPIVVLSAHDDRAHVIQAIDAGAMGYIPKSSKSTVLLNALRLVLAGGVYLPPQAMVHSEHKAIPEPNLTERQVQVLKCLVQGKPNKLICRELNMAEGTVKTHITAILKSLNVTTRTQAVIAVSRMGIDLERHTPHAE
jgi:DNA-binding NarL/FixJ family response regulator